MHLDHAFVLGVIGRSVLACKAMPFTLGHCLVSCDIIESRCYKEDEKEPTHE